jgi:hypothetical protein
LRIGGIPAAIATIAAVYLGSFRFRDNAVRYEVTGNAQWNELPKYQARAEPYNKDEAADTRLFLKNVYRFVDLELNSWSTLVRGAADVKNQEPKHPTS